MSFSSGPISILRRGSTPVDDTSSHLFIPCALRSCTNNPGENKMSASALMEKDCGHRSVGDEQDGEAKLLTHSLTHPARHQGWSWSNVVDDTMCRI